MSEESEQYVQIEKWNIPYILANLSFLVLVVVAMLLLTICAAFGGTVLYLSFTNFILVWVFAVSMNRTEEEKLKTAIKLPIKEVEKDE